MSDTAVECKRLESLWSGDFGDDYVDRNAEAGNVREPYWNEIMDKCRPSRVLEIGCNVGANLRWIAPRVPEGETWGIDVNAKAVARCRADLGVNAVLAQARELPFRDRWFDLTFTQGVLIHQPEDTLPIVMHEMVRTSRRFVLCGEYFAEQTCEVPYRGQTGALYKRDYGSLFVSLFPELREVGRGFLSRDDGWDDVTWWLFERTG